VEEKLGPEGIANLRAELEKEHRKQLLKASSEDRDHYRWLFDKAEYESGFSHSKAAAQSDPSLTFTEAIHVARQNFVNAAIEENARTAHVRVGVLYDFEIRKPALERALEEMPKSRADVVRQAIKELAPPVLSPNEILAARAELGCIGRLADELPWKVREEIRAYDGYESLDAIPSPAPDYALRSGVDLSHIYELESSTIDQAQWEAAGIFSEDRELLLSAMMCRPYQGECLVFPYRRPGKPGVHSLRVKRLGPNGGYGQRSGEAAGIYYPPEMLIDDGAPLRDTRRTLVWVEGEKKALALARLGYVVVGLPGVWMMHDAAHRRETDELRLHPWIREDVVVAGRPHVIVYDPDVQTNPHVMHAQRRLARLLWGAGADNVSVVRWPAVSSDIGGVDDLASAQGDMAVRQLITDAGPCRIGAVFIPAAVAEDHRLGAPAKVTYGILFGAADTSGHVTGFTLKAMGQSVGRSPRAVSDAMGTLESLGYVTRSRGLVTREKGDFTSEPDSYSLTGYSGFVNGPAYKLDAEMLTMSHERAVLLAALPDDGSSVSNTTLAKMTGQKLRALRTQLSALEAAGVVTRGHGSVAKSWRPAGSAKRQNPAHNGE
jgi:predicted transcriptional regulator